MTPREILIHYSRNMIYTVVIPQYIAPLLPAIIWNGLESDYDDIGYVLLKEKMLELTIWACHFIGIIELHQRQSFSAM